METVEQFEIRSKGSLWSRGHGARSSGSGASRWSSDGRELTLFAGDYMSLEQQAANHSYLETSAAKLIAGFCNLVLCCGERLLKECWLVLPELGQSKTKKEDEICTSSFSSSTIPLTSE